MRLKLSHRRLVLAIAGVAAMVCGGGVGAAEGVPQAPPVGVVATPQKDGLVLFVPPGWEVDDAASPVGTVVTGPGARIWIFVQNLDGLPATAAEYVGYGNRSVLQQWSGMQILLDRSTPVGGVPARILAWTRPLLKHVPGEDMNHYKEYNLIYGPRLVVTLQLKATAGAFPAAERVLHALAESLRFDPGALTPPTPAWSDGGEGRDWREWQTRDHLRWLLPEQGLVWGIYDPFLNPRAWRLDELRFYERSLETKFDLLMTYQSFPDPFPTRVMEEAARDERLVMLTLQSWEPVPPDKVYSSPTTLVFKLLQGEYDGYLREYARAAAGWGRPFFFRLDNEMNADWTPWGAFQYGKDADLYVYAWRHVWEIFREEGATNAIWVWNPNDTAFPDWKWNHHSRYWPGSAYVDWVGLTAYNLGDSYPDTVWREFRDAYKAVYDEYRLMYPGKPLMITEFASHDGGGDKARWTEDMFAALETDFPDIRFAVWWNSTDGMRRYRLDSTAAAREAFVRGLRDPYFTNRVRFGQ